MIYLLLQIHAESIHEDSDELRDNLRITAGNESLLRTMTERKANNSLYINPQVVDKQDLKIR